jgi:EF-P beta-lysylation protein EpmB
MSAVPSTWQRELSRAITDPAQLLAELELDPALAAPARSASSLFSLRVTHSYLARMRRGDARDPLLRQVLPLADELAESPGYGPDPLDEHAATRASNLLQKYSGRALLITTQACAIHCRYCFRREFPYSAQAEAAEGAGRFGAALDVIAKDTSIEEVILSGGDPLSLSDARLTRITEALEAMTHVQRIRIHTRQPIVLPSRVDEGLLAWLRGVKRPLVMVLHANHPNEIDDEVRAACAKLRSAGVTLLNQSVLLKGVNDSVETLTQLSRELVNAGVMPYYLHLPDRVRGTAHFDVAEAEAQRLVDEVAKRLSGYLVPRLVREVPGAPYKVPSVPI